MVGWMRNLCQSSVGRYGSDRGKPAAKAPAGDDILTIVMQVGV